MTWQNVVGTFLNFFIPGASMMLAVMLPILVCMAVYSFVSGVWQGLREWNWSLVMAAISGKWELVRLRAELVEVRRSGDATHIRAICRPHLIEVRDSLNSMLRDTDMICSNKVFSVRYQVRGTGLVVRCNDMKNRIDKCICELGK